MAQSVPRESKQRRTERAHAIVAQLEAAYPDSTCALRYDTPFQLLVATILSAQTTDVAVNKVTRTLFSRYPDAQAFAQADVDEVGGIIGSIGLWRSKAKNLVALSAILVDHHDGQVPSQVEQLVELPGVGRKTATAVLATAYGIPAGVTVDTHMLRINHHLGLSTATTADAMARDLEDILPQASWATYTHRIIDHGRIVCVALRPRCGVCPLAALCPCARSGTIGYRSANDERVPASAKAASWLQRVDP